MKHINKLLLIASLSTTSLSQAAPIVYFDFDGDTVMDNATTLQIGDSLTASLYVSDIDNTNAGLLSWGTQIDFTTAFLSATNYTIDPAWPLPGINNNIDNNAGTIELLASSFSAQTGTIKLADIRFDTLSAGLATLSGSELFPGNGNFVGFSGATGYDYDGEINFNSASVSITAVPLPSSLLFLSSGFIVLMRYIKQG